MNKKLLKGLLSAAVLGLTAPLTIGQTTTFTYTGSMQTYVVPAGVTMINIEAWGGQGEDVVELYSPQTGGLGGYATGDLSVTPGETLYIFVGGQGTNGAGGFNGGGTGGFSNPGSGGTGGYAGSGGGASDVRQGGTTFADRVIVAGGGGGAGRDYVNGSCVPCGTGGNGGAGGALTGIDGDDPWYSGILGSFPNPGAGGKGGTPSTGGLGGDGPEGPDGNPGVLGVGGNGINGEYDVASGGGGGGYYGGGAGAGASSGSGVAGGGGAGGSSYLGTLTSASTLPGINAGNGQIIITVLCDGLVATVSSDSICDGEEVILSAVSTNGGTISWDGGITDGVAFAPSVGTTTYTATSTAAEDCDFVVDIFVGALPTVDAGTDINLCEGDTVLLHGVGTATDWSWDNGITDSVYFTPATAGTTTYTLTGTIDSTGCMAMDMVDVTYNVINLSVSVTGITLDAAQVGASYQWINCPDSSVIGGATNQSFTPTQDGDYAVIIDLNGCVDTSTCATIAGVGISSFDNLTVQVLPNPNNGTFQLNLGQPIDGTILIYGLDGKIIRSEAIAQRTNIDFSFENMEAGVYMMQLNTAIGNSTVRIVVQ